MVFCKLLLQMNLGSWNTGVGQDLQYHRAVYPTAFGQRFRHGGV